MRRKNVAYSDEQVESDGVIFSPLNGKIDKIEEHSKSTLLEGDLYKINFKIPLGKEFGIYLPIKGEIDDVIFAKGKSLLFFGKKTNRNIELGEGLHLVIKFDDNKKVHIKFLKNILGFYPKLVVLPGDRGKRMANIGYFPFGGRAELYFSKDCEILIGESDFVEAGQTPILGASVVKKEVSDA